MDEIRKLNDDMRNDIKKILGILNGNGKVGLVAKVEHHDEQIKRWIALNTFLTTTTLGFVIAG